MGIFKGKVVPLASTGGKGVDGVVGDNVAADEEVAEAGDRANEAEDGEGFNGDCFGLAKSATAMLERAVFINGVDALSEGDASICLISFESVSFVERVDGSSDAGDNRMLLIDCSYWLLSAGDLFNFLILPVAVDIVKLGDVTLLLGD